MIDKESAYRVANEYLSERYESHMPVTILSEYTIEKNYGWLFFYNTKKYLETKIFRDGLAGNGPLLVEKSNGKVTALGSYTSPEEIIKDFERERGFSSD
ncbi:MAG: hypothetical protein G3M70_15620 [Candidatus Nitronauta litoralis]|uniref:Immunity protein 35 domain-containing protein n=1 Tax=Candidatus Nitronauta litoralis TaxID=2705533 RepID=A0A7T0BYC8_9BACT|nr:MAG: hypothetical protein G3M70_15620 [Candidatus Nitronauta litoralis]